MINKASKINAIIVILIILLCGCTAESNKKNIDRLEQDVKENIIQTKQQLNIGILNLDTLNPINTKNKMVQDVTRLIYDGLVDIDSRYMPKFNLAKDITSQNNLEWNIRIKEDIKWSDGEELVTSHVYSTIDKIMNENSIYYSNISNIKFIDIIDNYNIKITLKKNDPFFINKLHFPIVKMKKTKELVGTGPYKLEKKDDENILLISNNLYKGYTPYNKINIILYNNEDSLLREFKNNEIDILELPASEQTYNLVKVYKSDTYQSKNFNYIAFNLNKKYISDINIRRAIFYAINKEVIINNINNKLVSNSNLPIAQSSYLYPKNIITMSYDPNKSYDILQNSNFNIKTKGAQRTYNGRLQFSLLINADNPARQREAESIKNDLETIGIKINIIKKDYNSYMYSIKNKNYDIALSSYNLSMSPDILFSFYSNADNNYTSYKNKQYDTICDRIISGEEKDITSGIRQLSEMIINDIPIISLYYKNDIILCGKDINIYPKGNVWGNYNYIINK